MTLLQSHSHVNTISIQFIEKTQPYCHHIVATRSRGLTCGSCAASEQTYGDAAARYPWPCHAADPHPTLRRGSVGSPLAHHCCCCRTSGAQDGPAAGRLWAGRDPFLMRSPLSESTRWTVFGRNPANCCRCFQCEPCSTVIGQKERKKTLLIKDPEVKHLYYTTRGIMNNHTNTDTCKENICKASLQIRFLPGHKRSIPFRIFARHQMSVKRYDLLWSQQIHVLPLLINQF